MQEVDRTRRGLTPDESCEALTFQLMSGISLFFTKFGDGVLELLYPKPGKTHTCDGEFYTPELARDMRPAIKSLLSVRQSFDGPIVYLGDWMSMTSGAPYYVEEYKDLVGDHPHFLHFETVLLMRQSPELRMFYQALKNDKRRKVFMGPAQMRPAAQALGARFLEIPLSGLHAQSEKIYFRLIMLAPELLIWQGGIAGHIPVVRYWLETRAACVNLGSALDPLYRGKTRSQQLHPIQAADFLRGIF